MNDIYTDEILNRIFFNSFYHDFSVKDIGSIHFYCKDYYIPVNNLFQINNCKYYANNIEFIFIKYQNRIYIINAFVITSDNKLYFELIKLGFNNKKFEEKTLYANAKYNNDDATVEFIFYNYDDINAKIIKRFNFDKKEYSNNIASFDNIYIIINTDTNNALIKYEKNNSEYYLYDFKRDKKFSIIDVGLYSQSIVVADNSNKKLFIYSKKHDFYYDFIKHPLIYSKYLKTPFQLFKAFLKETLYLIDSDLYFNYINKLNLIYKLVYKEDTKQKQFKLVSKSMKFNFLKIDKIENYSKITILPNTENVNLLLL